MIVACFIIISMVGLISFYFRLKSFNCLPMIQSNAYASFGNIVEGMPLSEISNILGKKGKKVFNQNKYRWSFGDSIVVKKGNEVVAFADFDKDIDHFRDYSFKRSPAYIEMSLINGTLCNPVAVGLN